MLCPHEDKPMFLQMLFHTTSYITIFCTMCISDKNHNSNLIETKNTRWTESKENSLGTYHSWRDLKRIVDVKWEKYVGVITRRCDFNTVRLLTISDAEKNMPLQIMEKNSNKRFEYGGSEVVEKICAGANHLLRCCQWK